MTQSVLSLFDGISCARVALDRAGIKYDRYYASEIDKYAIKIAMKNYPDTTQVGDIQELNFLTVPKDVFLVVGGSPCQSLSSAASQIESGLEKGKSTLFWDYVRIVNLLQPRYFLLENVESMKTADRDRITAVMGVQPIMINSALVSAQDRKRYYWTNIPGIKQPDDKGILLKDVLETNVDQKYNIGKKQKARLLKRLGTHGNKINGLKSKTLMSRDYADWNGQFIIQNAHGFNDGGVFKEKSQTMTSSSFQHNNFCYLNKMIRRLTPVECERLQTLPDGYTEGVSDNQRYKALGNGFTVDVIAHILKRLANACPLFADQQTKE